jgi:hypothetical protein
VTSDMEDKRIRRRHAPRATRHAPPHNTYAPRGPHPAGFAWLLTFFSGAGAGIRAAASSRLQQRSSISNSNSKRTGWERRSDSSWQLMVPLLDGIDTSPLQVGRRALSDDRWWARCLVRHPESQILRSQVLEAGTSLNTKQR